MNYLDRHLRTLELARDCANLGARPRTIIRITGLSRSEVMHLLFEDAPPRSGKYPESTEWLNKANLFARIEASTFLSIYRDFRERGCEPRDALVGAFPHYRLLFCKDPRVTFDRAFDLVSRTDGLWRQKPDLSLVACRTCGARYLSSLCFHPVEADPCPFCKLTSRYDCDKRVRSYLPERALSARWSAQSGSGLFASLLVYSDKPSAA